MKPDARHPRHAELDALATWDQSLSTRCGHLLALRIAIYDLEKGETITAGPALQALELRRLFHKEYEDVVRERKNQADALVFLASVDCWIGSYRRWPDLQC